MTSAVDPFAVLRGEERFSAPPTRKLTWEPRVAVVAIAVFTLSSVLVGASALLVERAVLPPAEWLAMGMIGVWAIGAIIGYVGLCLWMQAVRDRLVEARYDAPASWKIWAGWVIPIYSLFAPFQVMRGLRTKVLWQSHGPVVLWWVTFLGANFVDRAYAVYPSIDNVSLMLLTVSALLVLVSCGALVHTVITTSDSL